MSYKVLITDDIEQLLKSPERRHLAFLLKRLEKDPRPKGSRSLKSQIEPDPNELEWRHGEFLISYRVDDTKKTVKVGIVTIKQ